MLSALTAVLLAKVGLGFTFVCTLAAVAVYTVPACVAATSDSYDWMRRKQAGLAVAGRGDGCSPEFLNAVS